MKVKIPSKCPRCGKVAVLVKHHTSYQPEAIEEICKECDAKDRRNPKTRGFKVLKSYPQRGIIIVPQYILNNLGALIEIETAPASPIAILFQYNYPLTVVVEVLDLIKRSIELRIEHQKFIEQKKEVIVNSKEE